MVGWGCRGAVGFPIYRAAVQHRRACLGGESRRDSRPGVALRGEDGTATRGPWVSGRERVRAGRERGSDERVRPVSGGAGERGAGERADRWARCVGGSGHERVGEAGRWAAARGEGERGLGCLRAGFWAGEKALLGQARGGEGEGWPGRSWVLWAGFWVLAGFPFLNLLFFYF